MAAPGNPDLSRATWRKSRYSNNGGNCVQVTATPGTVAVRDSKNPHGPALAFTVAAWQEFTRRIKNA